MKNHILETDMSVAVAERAVVVLRAHRRGEELRASTAGVPAGAGERAPPAGEAGVEEGLILLDENGLGRGPRLLAVGTAAVSPDHALLGYATDTEGAQHYQLHFKSLAGEGEGDGQLSAAPEWWPNRVRAGLVGHRRQCSTSASTRPSDPSRCGATSWGADPARDTLVFEEPTGASPSAPGAPGTAPT